MKNFYEQNVVVIIEIELCGCVWDREESRMKKYEIACFPLFFSKIKNILFVFSHETVHSQLFTRFFHFNPFWKRKTSFEFSLNNNFTLFHQPKCQLNSTALQSKTTDRESRYSAFAFPIKIYNLILISSRWYLPVVNFIFCRLNFLRRATATFGCFR